MVMVCNAANVSSRLPHRPSCDPSSNVRCRIIDSHKCSEESQRSVLVGTAADMMALVRFQSAGNGRSTGDSTACSSMHHFLPSKKRGRQSFKSFFCSEVLDLVTWD